MPGNRFDMNCKWKVLYDRLSLRRASIFSFRRFAKAVLLMVCALSILRGSRSVSVRDGRREIAKRTVDPRGPIHHDVDIFREKDAVQGYSAADAVQGQRVTPLIVFSPHAGPSGAYSPDGTMGYMMDGQQMMHRPPGDPAFHNQYAHYPAEYYGHHL